MSSLDIEKMFLIFMEILYQVKLVIVTKLFSLVFTGQLVMMMMIRMITKNIFLGSVI